MTNIINLSSNNQFISSPDSVAYQRIILNKINKPGFDRGYGDGQTLAQVEFGTHYAVSCAKYTVQKLKNNPQLFDNIIYEFSQAICMLYDIEFTQGLEALYEAIIQDLPELCISFRLNRVIRANISQQIALIVLADVYTEQPKYQAVLNILASYDRYNSAMK
jgi:hypothetical protein